MADEAELAETGDWEHVGGLVRSHYSAMTIHRSCPQKFYYRYVLGIGAPETAPTPERDFGSWWSVVRAAEALERGRVLGSLRAEPRTFTGVDNGPEFDMRTVTVGEVADAARAWWRTLSADVKDVWIEKLGEELPQRLGALFDRWLDEYADERRTEEPLGVEVRWERALPRPSGDARWEVAADMPEIVLHGAIDEVYFDRSRGLVVARDDKSHKRLAAALAVDDMMDSQLQLYAWGAAQVIAGWERGPVRAVGYDRARSVKPTTPAVTTLGSLSKSITDYDLATYLAWVKGPEGVGVPWGEPGAFYVSGAKKGLPKFGHYQAEETVIAKLSTPAARSIWFQRTTVPLSLAVIRSHLRAAVDTATDIWRTERRATVSHEASRNLVRTTCGYCDYNALCRAQMLGGAEGQYELAEFGLSRRDGSDALLEDGALTDMVR